jgi:hypothetical protein
MLVLVRAQSDPVALLPAIRRAVWAIDPNQPIADIKTMNQIAADNVGQSRLNMILMGGLADWPSFWPRSEFTDCCRTR